MSHTSTKKRSRARARLAAPQPTAAPARARRSNENSLETLQADPALPLGTGCSSAAPLRFPAPSVNAFDVHADSGAALISRTIAAALALLQAAPGSGVGEMALGCCFDRRARSRGGRAHLDVVATLDAVVS